MPLTIENAGALVPGIPGKGTMGIRKAKVLRAFYLDGKVCNIGDVVELPKYLFLECLNSKRVIPFIEGEKIEEVKKEEPPEILLEKKDIREKKRGGKKKNVDVTQ